MVRDQREQAASWYALNAQAQRDIGRGALASLWFKCADRIRNGDADHRLDQVIADQADYDRCEQASA